ELLLRKLLELRDRDLADFLLVRLLRPAPRLLLHAEAGSLLEHHGRRRRLHHEAEASIRIDRDDDGDDRIALPGALGVELLTERHDVDAVLTECRPFWVRRVRFACR